MKQLRKIIMAFLVAAVLVITFYNQYIRQLQDIDGVAKSKASSINRYLDLSRGFIDLMTIYGNNFMQDGAGDPELYSLLQYDADSDSYNLDAIEGTKNQNISGNLTGIGRIPDSGAYRDEINLALLLNQLFCSIYKKLPDAAWLYYTSKNDFINLYPWVSSKDFAFTEVLQTEQFYAYVTPENDPLREPLWTSVYLDHAGKGLMVTLTSPIYNKDTFMGAVSIDLTNEQLSQMIRSDYQIYIIDDMNSVIANSLDIKFETEVPTLDKLLNCSPVEVDKIKGIEDYSLRRIGGYYYYPVRFTNAPWKMIFRVPVLQIVGNSALLTLPILTICLLFLFTFLEVEKRKKTEKLLLKSLDEVTSYQKLLENAAKYDFLTSTVNRRGLLDLFIKIAEGKDESKPSIQFIMGDIDLFKQFNDRYGHAAGDKVLVKIATIMQNSIKSGEVVCRWGGEEFVIMLVGRTYGDAMLIAETIRREIESTVIPWENSLELRATMTFGVAESDGGETMVNSISKADHALYIGKEKGRNRVVGYREIMAGTISI